MTRRQYERICQNTESEGFNSLSAYLRFKALEQDYGLYEKVSEIHGHLLGEEVPKKKPLKDALPPF